MKIFFFPYGHLICNSTLFFFLIGTLSTFFFYISLSNSFPCFFLIGTLSTVFFSLRSFLSIFFFSLSTLLSSSACDWSSLYSFQYILYNFFFIIYPSLLHRLWLVLVVLFSLYPLYLNHPFLSVHRCVCNIRFCMIFNSTHFLWFPIWYMFGLYRTRSVSSFFYIRSFCSSLKSNCF